MPDLSRVAATKFRCNDDCRPEKKNGSSRLGWTKSDIGMLEAESMPVAMFADARVPIECKNEDCGAVHLYLVRDLVPNYSILCVDCRRPIDLNSDQWTDAVNATVDYYKAIIF
jgi:hypothetical protein